MGEISITKLLVVAALVVLLFGTKKLRTLGGDLGAAIKGFKKAMNDDDAAAKKGADVDLSLIHICNGWVNPLLKWSGPPISLPNRLMKNVRMWWRTLTV